MTRHCVVPNCNSGYKSCPIQRSLFKVPSSESLKNRWEASIPGNIRLKKSHLVCEKHFTEIYITRKYVQHDASGKIIAEVRENKLSVLIIRC